MYQINFAFTGQADLACIAIYEPDTKSFLNGCKTHGGRRRCDVEGTGGGRQASMSRHQHKEFEFGGAGSFQKNLIVMSIGVKHGPGASTYSLFTGAEWSAPTTDRRHFHENS